MILEIEPYCLQGMVERTRQRIVLNRRTEISARVVVRKNNVACPLPKRIFHHTAHVDVDGVDDPSTELLTANQMMLNVKHQRNGYFIAFEEEIGLQNINRILRFKDLLDTDSPLYFALFDELG